MNTDTTIISRSPTNKNIEQVKQQSTDPQNSAMHAEKDKAKQCIQKNYTHMESWAKDSLPTDTNNSRGLAPRVSQTEEPFTPIEEVPEYRSPTSRMLAIQNRIIHNVAQLVALKEDAKRKEKKKAEEDVNQHSGITRNQGWTSLVSSAAQAALLASGAVLGSQLANFSPLVKGMADTVNTFQEAPKVKLDFKRINFQNKTGSDTESTRSLTEIRDRQQEMIRQAFESRKDLMRQVASATRG